MMVLQTRPNPILTNLFVAMLAVAAVTVTNARAQDSGANAASPADAASDSATLLRHSVRQMLDQAEIERSHAAQYRALAETAGDAALAAERIERAAALEANAERLARRAAEMETRIAEMEDERARFRDRGIARLPDSMIGRWETAYIDRIDGPVLGEALVKRDGHSIDIDYGGKRYQSLSVTPSDDRYIIELQETDPSAQETDYTPPGDEIAALSGPVRLSLGDGETTINLATPEPADPGRVRLILEPDEEGRRLSGHWIQRVDAVSGRDDAGGGRNGYPVLGSRESGGVILFGRETWRRPPAAIKLAFATENQSAIDEFDEPFWTDPDGASSVGRPVTLAEQRRVLYVVGYGLPEFLGEPIVIESLDEDVDYSVHSLEEDMQRDDFEGFFGRIMRDAQNRLEATEAAGALADPVTGDETRLLINATLKAGVKPGPKTLRINGAEATWQLTFGDHRADMVFVRDLADGLDQKPADAGFQPEATDVLMRPETVYFEIRATRPLPYEEIPLLFSLNDRALLFGETRQVPAIRLAEDPLIYRTGPIRIADPADNDSGPDGGLRIGAYSGDRLTAALGLEAGTLIANPPAVTARIADHPAETGMMAATGENAPALFWDRAVTDAAACHDISADNRSIDDLARRPADSIDRYLLISWLDNDNWDLSTIGSRWRKVSVTGRRDDAVFRLNVDISVGQHSAMILTRRALVNALKEQRRQLDELVDDNHIRGFRRMIERTMTGSTPWDDLKVGGPDGGTLFFPQTFYDRVLERRYGLGGIELDRYQIAATREALRLMKQHVGQAIALASEPEDCDVEDMLILTGMGMRNVVGRAKTVLMQCRERDETDRLGTAAALTGGRCLNWVANRQAHAHMDAIALIGASFAEQKAIAEWDHSVALLMATAVTLPVGAWGGAIGAGISATIGTGGTIVGAVVGIETERAEQRELDFARGAAVVTGNDRYHIAREFDISYIPVVINTMFGVFQIGNDIASIRNAVVAQRSLAAATQLRIRMEIQAAYRKTRVELGRILARQMLRREVSLASLNQRQAGDLSMAIAEARALESSIGREAMETAELSALRFSELVESGELSPVSWSRRPPDSGSPPSVPPNRSTGVDPDATVEFDMPNFDPLEDTGELAAGTEKAWWGRSMSDSAYRRLRSLPMAERDDVIRLATRQPEGFSAALADDHALEALYRPQPSLESLQDDVRRLGRRAPPRGRGYYEQAHPDAGDPDHLHFDVSLTPDGSKTVVTVYSGRPAATPGPVSDADAISEMVARDQLAQVGYFKLGLESDTAFDSGRQILVIDTVQSFPNVDIAGIPPRDPTGAVRPHAPAPVWVRDVDIPLRPDAPGVPFAMYSEHRGMQALGIEYADARIGAVELRNVENANTAIELYWMRHAFPTTHPDELVRHTSLYRHVESMLEQAGLRITDARFTRDVGWAITAPADSLVSNPWFNPGTGGSSLADVRNQFLRTFGLRGTEDIEIGFNIDLRVEPIAN